MENAGIITQVQVDQVKCVGPMTLASKGYDGSGLTIEQLQYRANEECEKAGLPTMWESGSTVPMEKNYSADADSQRVWW